MWANYITLNFQFAGAPNCRCNCHWHSWRPQHGVMETLCSTWGRLHARHETGAHEFSGHKHNKLNNGPVVFDGFKFLCHGDTIFGSATELWPKVFVIHDGCQKIQCAVFKYCIRMTCMHLYAYFKYNAQRGPYNAWIELYSLYIHIFLCLHTDTQNTHPWCVYNCIYTYYN